MVNRKGGYWNRKRAEKQQSPKGQRRSRSKPVVFECNGDEQQAPPPQQPHYQPYPYMVQPPYPYAPQPYAQPMPMPMPMPQPMPMPMQQQASSRSAPKPRRSGGRPIIDNNQLVEVFFDRLAQEGISANEFCDYVGYHKNTISDWRRGEKQVKPQVAFLFRRLFMDLESGADMRELLQDVANYEPRA